jgi:hypothetical protein
VDLLSISLRCEERQVSVGGRRGELFTGQSYKESFIPEGRHARAAAFKMGNCPEMS